MQKCQTSKIQNKYCELSAAGYNRPGRRKRVEIAFALKIDIAALMDVMRQMAIEGGVALAEPDILAFHREVVGSINRYGRTHKLEIMMRYKIGQLDLFSDIDVGLKMLAKRKLDLLPSKISDQRAINRIVQACGVNGNGGSR
jgi:hypothetical protein